ncbi:MAG: GH109 [uncultured Chloroflexia bacterium]|uniref:GH109 n=1 Tax=uncultured Chloroflexia bacterium TaxID=1672391 RepID=A0A6J4IIT6_9CHLR|nr:MAG: GH109 [uncultured Chloroflexia bacterium]
MIRLGLLGLGIAGQRHLKGFHELNRRDVQIYAVASSHVERTDEVALPPGTKVYTDYRELIRDAAIDAVIVALPHALHKDAAIYAARHGKHVLLEKPMATTMADAERIAAAFEESGTKLMLAYVHRFREEIIVAKRMMVAGELGAPASVLDRFCVPGGEDLPEWVWNQELSGGGVMMYSGLHSVDRLRWLLDSEVVEVYARVQTYGSHPQAITIENGLAAMLTFENGVISTLVENLPPYELQYRYWDTEIFGTTGMLHIRTDDYLEFTSPDVNFKQTFQGYNHYARQINEFVNAIREDRAPAIGVQDGMRSLAVAVSIYRSAYVGRSVLVSQAG